MTWNFGVGDRLLEALDEDELDDDVTRRTATVVQASEDAIVVRFDDSEREEAIAQDVAAARFTKAPPL